MVAVKEVYLSIKEKINKFYTSIFFPILICFLILIGHAFVLETPIFIILGVATCIGFVFCEDVRFFICPLLATVFLATPTNSPNVPNYSDYYFKGAFLIAIIITSCLVLGGLAIFIIRNYKKGNHVKLNGLFISILALIFALLLNGLFSENYTFKNLVFALAFGVSLGGLFYLFSKFLIFDKNLLKYFLNTLFIIGLLLFAELIVCYFQEVRFVDGNIDKESLQFGWGVWASMGSMLSMLLPVTFYFVATKKYGFIFYGYAVLTMFAILFSMARGPLLFGGIIFAVCAIICCFKGKNVKINRLILLGLVVVGIITFIVLFDKIYKLLYEYFSFGFNDNGRYEKWLIGLKHFKENIIFGSGFYDSYNHIETGDCAMNIVPYYYHNTLIQMLASGGIVGFIAYCYHRYQTIKLVFKKPTLLKTFLGLSILSLLLISLLDTQFFNFYPMFYYAVILVFMQNSDKFKNSDNGEKFNENLSQNIESIKQNTDENLSQNVEIINEKGAL